MNRKLSDLVIMSDVDGTLLHTGSRSTPERNLEALKRFTSKGGRFAIATGRSREFTRPLVNALPVNFPCIIFNGGALYDFQKEEYLVERHMSDDAREYLRAILKEFPDCGGVLVDGDSYWDIDGVTTKLHGTMYPNNFLQPARIDEVAGPIFKALLILPPERCKLLYEYTEQLSASGVRFVFTNDHMIEMLPEGSSKGVAMEKLVELTGVKRENIVAVGDYYNDIEMIEYAGIGVTLIDSPEDIKSVAQMIVCPCRDGALADLVEKLEEKYEYYSNAIK